MLNTKYLKALHIALLVVVLGGANNAQAATYNVYGNVNLIEATSQYANPTGQAIVDTLVGKYAAFSATIDTTVPDTDPSADVFLLNTSVTTTANIGGINFGTDSNSCFSVQFDCKVTVENNYFDPAVDFDSQFISSQLMKADALGANSRLNFYYSTIGAGLFTEPQLIDPFSATFTSGLSIIYLHEGQFQRINFELSNITTTPVPEPKTSAMFGAALLLFGLRLKQKRTTV